MVEFVGLPLTQILSDFDFRVCGSVPETVPYSGMNPDVLKIVYCCDTIGELNGVACTIEDTASVLRAWGREVSVIHPGMFPSVLNPVDQMTRLSWVTPSAVRKLLLDLRPDAIHVDTEGPIGWATLCAARQLGVPVSSCLHTRWDLYMQHMFFLPPSLTWKYLRWFHGSANRIFVPSVSIQRILHQQGLTSTALWIRGVDMKLFYPRPKTTVPWSRPMLLYVGRIAKEKDLPSLLSSNFPGTLVIVGRGPELRSYLRKYSDLISRGKVVFLGERRGEDLASLYSNADLFVLPSRTETFGRVVVEALASGVPVVSYPAPGPADILQDERVGVLDADFPRGIEIALRQCEPLACVEYAKRYSWEYATSQFLSGLIPINWKN